MILVDKDIKHLLQLNRIRIQSTDKEYPFEPNEQISSGSIDLRFSRTIRKYKTNLKEVDLTSSDDTSIKEIKKGEALIIRPGEIILTTTIEAIILPPDIGGIITGRSSFARLGLMVQCAQDFVNPGHGATIALQLVNVTKKPIKIQAGLKICQIVLLRCTSNSDNPYSANEASKYKNEVNTQPSKIGIELGLETERDLRDSLDSQNKDNQNSRELKRWRDGILKAEREKAVKNISSAISTPIYMVLGALISVIVPEVTKDDFPTSVFTFSIFGIVFLVVLLFIMQRRRNE